MDVRYSEWLLVSYRLLVVIKWLLCGCQVVAVGDLGGCYGVHLKGNYTSNPATSLPLSRGTATVRDKALWLCGLSRGAVGASSVSSSNTITDGLWSVFEDVLR